MHRRFHDKYFDRGLRGWIVRTAKKKYWRVAAYHDISDLIQEGLLAYAICRARYRDKVENRRHFMSLVQVVFMHRITDLANERTNTNEVCISQIAAEGKELVALEYLAGGIDGDAELVALLASAPAEVRAYLQMLQSPQGRAKLDVPLRRRADGTRETTSEHLTTVLGMPVADMDVALRRLLEPQPDPDQQWAAFFNELFFPTGVADAV